MCICIGYRHKYMYMYMYVYVYVCMYVCMYVPPAGSTRGLEGRSRLRA